VKRQLLKEFRFIAALQLMGNSFDKLDYFLNSFSMIHSIHPAMAYTKTLAYVPGICFAKKFISHKCKTCAITKHRNNGTCVADEKPQYPISGCRLLTGDWKLETGNLNMPF
jgi:hypothetical protein